MVQRPTDDLVTEPYWWDDAPRPMLPVLDLPKQVDVVVVGSGYTGLSAALTLARAGREVLVLEAEAAGWGASSRNQGHIGLLTRSSFASMEQRYGRETALALVREGMAAIAFVIELIGREGIDCHLRTTGRFVAAAKTSSYDALAREGEVLRREAGVPFEMVPRAEMLARELVSDAYVGGQVRLAEASLHGAMLQSGLMARVMEAGARIATGCRVTGFDRCSDGVEVRTARGPVVARDVVIATDALTGDLVPWLQRRIIPVGAGGIATEPMPLERIREVIPGLRPTVDTWKVGNTIRPAPDHSRLIFGGRRTMVDTDPRTAARGLQAKMVELFPQLDGVRVTHGWLGKVSYTFQTLPHIGTVEGLHYATGYCGYGVAMATWLGHRTGQRILRTNDAATAYDDLPFETRPLYRGRPWFLPLTLAWYRTLDAVKR